MANVLIVDEDAYASRQLCLLLTSRGVSEIMHAATEARALELLITRPDWVILDMDLSYGSGLEIMQAIRHAKLATRVVVLASTKDAGTIAAFAAYRPELILPKPLDPALLPIGRD